MPLADLLAGVVADDADLEADACGIRRKGHLLDLHEVQRRRVEPHEACMVLALFIGKRAYLIFAVVHDAPCQM